MFDWQCCFNVSSVRGYVSLIGSILAAASSSFALLVFVGRAKKCLDFCTTMYLFHFVAVCLVSQSLPAAAVWWVLNVVGVIISTVCSELLCLRREMQEIPVSSIV
jgi:protein SYS1